MNSETTKTNDTSAAVLVWDSEADPPPFDGMIALWRSFGAGLRQPVVSVPNLVESDSIALKKRYLKWVFNLGEVQVYGQRLVDFFEIRPGFSYWWMTPLVEKCNFAKSPQIDHAIRLMAFQTWIVKWDGTHVTLSSPDSELAECIRGICEKSGLLFEWRRTANVEARNVSLLKYVFRQLPCALQALIWLLRYLVDRYPLKGVGVVDWSKSKGRTTFVSYLDNLVPNLVSEGRFESRYWAHLPSLLEGMGTKTNWLHLYVPDQVLATPTAAATAIRKFNVNSKVQQAHVTLDSFLSGKVIFRTIRDFCRLVWIAIRLKPSLFFESTEKVNLWPIFTKEWSQSFFGVSAMQSVLYFNLFEEAMSAIDPQTVGVYLQENQGWEFAMIHSWRSAGHGRIVGSPHSTVRDWDLRYFFAPETYRRSASNPLPLPDQVALNGGAARRLFLDWGYQYLELVDVEALRYLYLDNYQNSGRLNFKMAAAPLQMVVVGDYLLKNFKIQMGILEKFAESFSSDIQIQVKPHPNCPIELRGAMGIDNTTFTSDPISKLLSKSDVMFSGSVTSASVDAYCAGIPVISILDPNTLNLSPLRGREGVVFVTTPKELADAVMLIKGRPSGCAHNQDFFNLDSKLPRWLNLLRGQGS